MSIRDYFLDLSAVGNLKTEDERKSIMDLYKGIFEWGASSPAVSESIMNTLIFGGFLKNVVAEQRDIKINKVITNEV